MFLSRFSFLKLFLSSESSPAKLFTLTGIFLISGELRRAPERPNYVLTFFGILVKKLGGSETTFSTHPKGGCTPDRSMRAMLNILLPRKGNEAKKETQT